MFFIVGASDSQINSITKQQKPTINPDGEAKPLNVTWSGLDNFDKIIISQVSTVLNVLKKHGAEIWGINLIPTDLSILVTISPDRNERSDGLLINYPKRIDSAKFVTLDSRLGFSNVQLLTSDLLEANFPENFADKKEKNNLLILETSLTDDPHITIPTLNRWQFEIIDKIFDKWILKTYPNCNGFDFINIDEIYPFDKENISLALLESEIILAAIKSNDLNYKRKALQYFIAIRSYRTKKNKVIRFDSCQESRFGPLNYAESQYSKITGLGIDSQIPTRTYGYSPNRILTLSNIDDLLKGKEKPEQIGGKCDINGCDNTCVNRSLLDFKSYFTIQRSQILSGSLVELMKQIGFFIDLRQEIAKGSNKLLIDILSAKLNNQSIPTSESNLINEAKKLYHYDKILLVLKDFNRFISQKAEFDC